jgi:hypothetical protein
MLRYARASKIQSLAQHNRFEICCGNARCLFCRLLVPNYYALLRWRRPCFETNRCVSRPPVGMPLSMLCTFKANVRSSSAFIPEDCDRIDHEQYRANAPSRKPARNHCHPSQGFLSDRDAGFRRCIARCPSDSGASTARRESTDCLCR